MDYKQDPLYDKFKKEQSTQQQQIPSYKQDPLYEKFKQEQSNSQSRMDKIDEYIPDFAQDFVHGAAKNITDYTASAAKLFGNKELQNKARTASNTLKRNIDNEYVGMAGEMLGDPLNLTPAGIISKGTKAARVVKSMAAGAGVGAATMAAKDYGNDSMTTDEKITDAGIGAGFVSAINGIIAGVTKGKVTNAIKPEMVQGAKSNEDVANAILNNANSLGLNKQEANEVVGEVLKGKYPKVSEQYKREKAGFGAKLTEPNFQLRQKNPPAVTMDRETALAILAKDVNKKRVSQGLEPIYPEVPEAYRKETILPQQEVQSTPNFVSGDFNSNMPMSGEQARQIALNDRYAKIASHPRLQELLDMREPISAKDSNSPQIQLQKRDIRQKNIGKGWETEVTPALYEKNYNYDFQLSKQDIKKLRSGKFDEDLANKLEADLDTLDNHPDYAKSFNSENNIDYKAELEKLDNTDVKLSKDDWEEANAVFAKGIDNVAVATYAGINEDENGNITFDPEKFILGLGGYTAVKQALKNGTIRGKLKEISTDAIDRVNFNPEVQKNGNSFNSMIDSNSMIKDIPWNKLSKKEASKMVRILKAIPNNDGMFKNNTIIRTNDGDVKVTDLFEQKEKDRHLDNPKLRGMVTTEEVASFPKVSKNIEATKSYQGDTWKAKTNDGADIVYGSKEFNDENNLITVHTKTEKGERGQHTSNVSSGSINDTVSMKSSNEKIIPQKQEKPKGFLAKVAQIRKEQGLPEKGTFLYHPQRDKKYYLSDNGVAYFQRGNGSWREMPNEEIIKDLKFIKEHGVKAFREDKIKSDAEFKQAEDEFNKKENDSYKMEHTAPTANEVNSRADNVEPSFSDDVYSKDAMRLLGHGDKKIDEESINVIKSAKGNPNKEITIYRAIPKDIDADINPSDWVTTSKGYAKQHGESALDGNYKILEKKVKAKDLWTDGNSIHEWGYDPHTDPKKLMANGMHSMAGGFAGGADSLINQRDYNQDGKYNYKDLLMGVAAGAISINALKKMAPKLFEEEASNGSVKAGLFAGEKAKGYDVAKDAGKTFTGKYDKQKRFEIDDSKATFHGSDLKKLNGGEYGNEEYKLETLLDHNKLFENYPEVKDIKVQFDKDTKGASFESVNVNGQETNSLIKVNSNLSDEEMKSAILHEIQHAIQKKEGFARGGSAQEFYNDAKRKIDLLKYELEFEPDDFIRDKKFAELSKLEKEFENGAKEEAFKKYQNLAGEIEARDVQARADFTPEERAKIEPYSSENIPEEEAIVKFHGDGGKLAKKLMGENSETLEAFKNKFKTAKKKSYVHLQKIVSKEAQKEWGDVTSWFRRNWTDTLGKDYHNVREDATSSTNGYSVKMERLHHALKELSEDDRIAMHEYIAGERENVPQQLKPLADNIKKTIDDFSKELVEKGVLEKEAYDEWAGFYIHRNYEKHFFKDVKNLMSKGFKIDDIKQRGNIKIISAKEAQKLLTDVSFIADTQKPLRDGGRRLRKLPNGKYELKRDWTKEEREAMGEITDIAISAPETLMRLKRMADNANFLEKVSNIDEVVLKDAEKFTDEEIKASGFIKAPNNPKYGVLAGKHIRLDVFNDISARNDEIFNTFHDSDAAMSRIWKGYLSLWKKSKTVWNAPSHLNNFISNQYLMHLAGMKSHEIFQAIGRAGKMMYEGNKYENLLKKQMIGKATEQDLKDLATMGEDLKYFIEAKEGGLLGRSQLNDILAGQQKLTRNTALGKLDRFAEDMYHGEDAIGKISMYAHLRGKVGMSEDEARKAVLTIIPDYSKPMPKGYRVLRDTGISPFISWSYYTMPAIWKLLKTKKGAKQASIAIGTLAGLEYVLTGGEVTPLDNLPFVNGSKPSDFKGRRFGVGKHGDTITTIKTDRWIPYVELSSPVNFLISNVSGPTTNAIVNLLTAPSKAGMINPYYGRPITYKNKSTGQKSYDYAKYLTQSYVPLPAQLYTGWNTAETMLRSKKNRRRNKVVEPRSTFQELMKNIGLNSLSYSKSQAIKENKN